MRYLGCRAGHRISAAVGYLHKSFFPAVCATQRSEGAPVSLATRSKAGRVGRLAVGWVCASMPRPELGKAGNVALLHCSEPPENGIYEADVFSKGGSLSSRAH
jgi:hypothetical protein